jgi:hypothetical protein
MRLRMVGRQTFTQNHRFLSMAPWQALSVKMRGVCEKHPLSLRLQGFSAVWDASGTVLTCVEQQKHAQHRSIIIAVAVASAAVLAVALIVWRQYLRTRPRWLREGVLQVCAQLLLASQHPLLRPRYCKVQLPSA